MSDLTIAQVQQGTRCPLPAVTTNWPLILQALVQEEISHPLVQVAAASTVAVETAWTFQPIKEYGPDSYFQKYEPGTSIGDRLGNTEKGDGLRYKGRGFVQITGRANYGSVGAYLDVDLEETPDLALEPMTAARVLAWYFRERRVAEAAEKAQWRRTRRLVNGGVNGLDDYMKVVTRLLDIVKAG